MYALFFRLFYHLAQKRTWGIIFKDDSNSQVSRASVGLDMSFFCVRPHIQYFSSSAQLEPLLETFRVFENKSLQELLQIVVSYCSHISISLHHLGDDCLRFAFEGILERDSYFALILQDGLLKFFSCLLLS